MDTINTSDKDKILGTKKGAIGTLTFNYPERLNAISPEMSQAAAEVIGDFAADPAIRVVILRGAGTKAFVSGGDISKYEGNRSTPEQIAAYNKMTSGFRASLRGIGKPTIAMIRGWCLGGGLAIALNCDMRICSEDAQFGIPAAKLGIGYSAESLAQLIELVGPALAKEVLFTARRYTAYEAHRIGLVNHVCQASMLESFVNSYAETMANNAPLSIVAAKRVIDEYVKDPEKRNQKLADDAVAACFASEDYKEGRKAFMEKRKPVWTGK
jgi:enoyl-CoA hydratase/carnithine racemase